MISSVKKMKIYPQVLTFSLKPQNWHLHVVVLKTTVDNGRQMYENETMQARAEHANILLLLILSIVYSDSRTLKYE